MERTAVRPVRSRASVRAMVAAEVAAHLAAVAAERQAAEDRRANARNRNRIYMLLFAIAMMFSMARILTMAAPSLIPYAAPLALVPDAALTVWAYLRKL